MPEEGFLMSTRDRKQGKTFSTVEHLEKQYSQNSPELSFSAGSVEEYQKWREKLKAKLIDLLGLFPEKCDLEPQIIEKEELRSYYREKIILQPEKGLLMPTYFLIPKKVDFPAPVVLALHGHGRGVIDVLGEAESPTWRKFIKQYNCDYAHKLAQKGFIVFAPEVRGFGEREKDSEKPFEPRRSGYDYRTSCRKSSFNAILLGQSLVGRRVWDMMRSIDYLETRPEVDAKKIGCLGVSLGGLLTMWTAALEDRIKVAVISCYLNTFRDSIMAVKHCECNYVPNILQYAEMYDICGLIAPRPLFIESGTNDTDFPLHASEFSFEKVRQVYRLLGQEEKLERDFFAGGHGFNGGKSFSWLKKWLLE